MEAKYSVLLRADLPPAEASILGRLAGRVVCKSGVELLKLSCSEIDLSHPYLAELKVIVQDNPGHPLWIPQHYIFLVSGAGAKMPIGFLADLGGTD